MLSQQNESESMYKKMQDIRNNSDKKNDFPEAFYLLIQEIFDEYSTEDSNSPSNSNIIPYQKGLTQLSFTKFLHSIPGFFVEKMFQTFKTAKENPNLSLEEFSEPLKILKFGSFLEMARLVFEILDFDLSGELSYQNLKTLTSLIPVFRNNLSGTSDFLYQQESIRTLNTKILQPFFDKNKINFQVFIDVILQYKSENIFLLIFSYLYENIPILRKTLLMYKIRYHSSSSSLESFCNSKNSNSKTASSTQISYANGNFEETYLTSPKWKEYSLGLPRFQAKKNVTPPVTMRKTQKIHSKFEMNKLNINSLTFKSDLKEEDSAFKNYNKTFDSLEDDNDLTSKSISEWDLEEQESRRKTSSLSAVSPKVQNIFVESKEEPNTFIEEFNLDNDEFNLHEKDLEELNKCIIKEGELLVKDKEQNPDNSIKLEESLDKARDKESSKKDESLEKNQDTTKESKTRSPQLKKVYLVLIDKNLYFYDKKDSRENYYKTHYLHGGFVRINQPEMIDGVSYSGFTLFFLNNITASFYHVCQKEANNWIKSIRNSTNYKNVFDHFKIYSEIGKGSYGKVCHAKEISTGKECAIKIIDKTSSKKKNNWELIKGEIDIMKIVSHKNIVKFIDSYENSNFTFIIMEFLKYGSLTTFLERKRFKVSEKLIKGIVLQISKALKYLHDFGIIHRDLKPDNILIVGKSENDEIIIKLTDFGFGKILGVGENAKERFGTLYFTAPEILRAKPYNAAIDVWSLGVCIFYMLTGDLPFYKNSLDLKEVANAICYNNIKYNIRLSDNARNLIEKCLTKDPQKRISIDEVINHQWFII